MLAQTEMSEQTNETIGSNEKTNAENDTTENTGRKQKPTLWISAYNVHLYIYVYMYNKNPHIKRVRMRMWNGFGRIGFVVLYQKVYECGIELLYR